MTELWQAIQKWEQTIQTENEKRELLALIISLMAAISGFPIPPNAPNPETAPIAELDAYEALCHEAYTEFAAG